MTAAEPLTAEALAAMLTNQTEACAPAREALLSGGTYLIFSRTVPANESAGIYGIRLRRTRKLGYTTIGGDETRAILRRFGDQPLRVGEIWSADRSWYYQLHLDPEATRVLTCAGHARTKPEAGE